MSAELFCDSYNQARNKKSTDEDYFDAKAFNQNDTYGYLYKTNAEGYGYYTDNSKYAIQNSTCSGIYNYSSSAYPWLSSPSAFTSGAGTHVAPSRLIYYATWFTGGVRPAVSLPSSISIQLVN